MTEYEIWLNYQDYKSFEDSLKEPKMFEKEEVHELSYRKVFVFEFPFSETLVKICGPWKATP